MLISINVLALIIVGGMGSLPGVALGSIALIGLPELLREFGEYRYLFYGAVLIIMMRLRPEGCGRRRRAGANCTAATRRWHWMRALICCRRNGHDRAAVVRAGRACGLAG